MNVTIKDAKLLRQLSHIAVKAYLASQGWHEKGSFGKYASIHTHANTSGEEWEILLPNQSQIADYAARMADVLSILAQVEQRSELLVFGDLQQVSRDMSRVRVPDPDEDAASNQDGV